MSTNKGTLIIAPIRPNDSRDLIPTAYSSEILGGLHSVSNINDRNSIPVQRREWGMLVSVYNDGFNSGIYVLRQGYANNDLSDNGNWDKFPDNWLRNVLSIITDPSQAIIGSQSSGDSYIIGSPSTGLFTGKEDMIAVVNFATSSNWVYYEPRKGDSTTNLDDSIIYLYSGDDWPLGNWIALGSVGTSGTSGTSGAIGSVGPQGPQGGVGATGPQGDIGPIGPTGPTGPQGGVGTTGPQGDIGPIGPTGSVGPQGGVGTTGPQGDIGPIGPTGSVGPQGAQGAIGPQGPSDGPPGPQGPQGSPGVSVDWIVMTASGTASNNFGHIVNGVNINITLPSSITRGNYTKFTGNTNNPSSYYRIYPPQDKVIYFGDQTTSPGLSGYIQSTATNSRDSIELVVVNDFGDWIVMSAVGTWIIV